MFSFAAFGSKVIFFFGRRNYKILHKTKSLNYTVTIKDYSSCSEEVFHSLLGGNLSIFLIHICINLSLCIYAYMYICISIYS